MHAANAEKNLRNCPRLNSKNIKKSDYRMQCRKWSADKLEEPLNSQTNFGQATQKHLNLSPDEHLKNFNSLTPGDWPGSITKLSVAAGVQRRAGLATS